MVAGACDVPGAGLEPARPQWPQDFKSWVSTNSTIRARYWCRQIKKNLFSEVFLSGKRDSNPRPRPWQGRALPAELFPRCWFCDCKYTFFYKNPSIILSKKKKCRSH